MTQLSMNVDLHKGDCIEVMSRMQDRSVSAIIADLPYGRTNAEWDSEVCLKDFWLQASRVCVGPVVMFAQTPFDKVLGASNIKELRYEWVWEKSNPTGFLNAKKQPMRAHENILVFYGKPTTYNPQKTVGHPRKTATRRKVQDEGYGKQRSGLVYDSTERYPRSVLKFPSDKQKSALHSAQKPLALMEYLVRTYTNHGDVILDPTMGSGTTGLAAVNMGRRFVGIEISPKYYGIAKQRILGE